MATCPRCEQENPDNARFCMQCGIRLARVQPKEKAPKDADQLGGAAATALESRLRARLFTEGAQRQREDVEQWMSLFLTQNQRPSLVNAKLKGLDLGQIDFVGVDLRMADLTEASLKGANLFLANLRGVRLCEAYLFLSNLQEADLGGADLTGANLQLANLINANLRLADLRSANLSRAKLQGASMAGANLQGAILRADLSVNTILPDGKAWEPTVNLARFTDSTHPNFWRSNDVTSPAYAATHP